LKRSKGSGNSVRLVPPALRLRGGLKKHRMLLKAIVSAFFLF